jgi:hypothetical protein
MLVDKKKKTERSQKERDLRSIGKEKRTIGKGEASIIKANRMIGLVSNVQTSSD